MITIGFVFRLRRRFVPNLTLQVAEHSCELARGGIKWLIYVARWLGNISPEGYIPR